MGLRGSRIILQLQSCFSIFPSSCKWRSHKFVTEQVSVNSSTHFTDNKIRVRTDVITSLQACITFVWKKQIIITSYHTYIVEINKLYSTWGKSLLLLAMFTSRLLRRREIRTSAEQFTDLGNDQWEIFEPPPAPQAYFLQVAKRKISFSPKNIGGKKKFSFFSGN